MTRIMKSKTISWLLILALVVTMMPIMGAKAHGATSTIQPPANLRWEGNTAKWENPNEGGVVRNSFFNLYTSDGVNILGTSAGASFLSRDCSDYLIPGKSYYFEAFFSDQNDVQTQKVQSSVFTVPGTYTPTAVTNVVLDKFGKVSWSIFPKASGYQVKLYKKDGGSWVQAAIENIRYGHMNNHTFSLVEGETYKASVTAIQGNDVLSTETNSNEILNVSEVHLSDPTNLRWEGNVAKWDNTNETGLTEATYFALYTSYNWNLSGVTAGGSFASQDCSSMLMPGQRYYFTVTFKSVTNHDTQKVKSPVYTVPGSYTLPKISNFTWNDNGQISWTSVKYAKEYELKLLELQDGEWVEIKTKRTGAPSYNWAPEMQSGKVYKTSLLAVQGTTPVSELLTSPKFPHQHDIATEREDLVPATPSTDGSYTEIKKCTDCDEEISRSTVTIPKWSKVELSTTSYTYTGGTKKPSVTLRDASGDKLVANVDYKVSYASGRKYVGTYKVTVTGIGDYSGTESKSFKINPPTTYITSLSKSKKAFTVKWKKKTSQVSGYQIMYARNSKFTNSKKTKTITSYKTTSKKITKLSAKKKYYVKVRTYKTVKGVKYYSSWSKVKSVTTR